MPIITSTGIIPNSEPRDQLVEIPRKHRYYYNLTDFEDEYSKAYVHPSRLVDIGVAENGIVVLRNVKYVETYAYIGVHENVKQNEIWLPVCMAEHCLRLDTHDFISVRPKTLVYGNRIEVQTYKKYLTVYNNFTGDLKEAFLTPFFKDQFRLVRKGDIFQPRNKELKLNPYFKVLSTDPEDGCIVNENTVIVCNGPPMLPDELMIKRIGYQSIGGVHKQLEQVKQIVELPLKYPQVFSSIGIQEPNGILLYGLPGTGKCLLARTVATETKVFFYEVKGRVIISKKEGKAESSLRKAFLECEKNAPAILFIDDIDLIAPKRDTIHGESRVASELLTLMDGLKPNSKVKVIAATTRPMYIDDALRRFGRFDREIDMGIPDRNGRVDILLTHMHKYAWRKVLEKVADVTHGFVGADLASLCTRAALELVHDKIGVYELDEKDIHNEFMISRIDLKYFQRVLAKMKPSSFRETNVETPDISWKQVGGLEDIKRQLEDMIQYPLLHVDLFLKFNLRPSHGILLYGPPGCGKTMLAKAITRESKANFITIKGPELLTSLLGEPEANVRNIFDKARAAAPCVVFFDEIDEIAKMRSGSVGDANGPANRVLNQIFIEFDGVESNHHHVFVIGATNRPELIDTALLRPGRLDQLVYVTLPKKESRLEILKVIIGKSPIEQTFDYDKLAEQTHAYSGADIAELFQRACKLVIRESLADPTKNVLTNEHFNTVLRDMAPSVHGDDVIKYDSFEKNAKRTRSYGYGTK